MYIQYTCCSQLSDYQQIYGARNTVCIKKGSGIIVLSSSRQSQEFVIEPRGLANTSENDKVPDIPVHGVGYASHLGGDGPAGQGGGHRHRQARHLRVHAADNLLDFAAEQAPHLAARELLPVARDGGGLGQLRGQLQALEDGVGVTEVGGHCGLVLHSRGGHHRRTAR